MAHSVMTRLGPVVELLWPAPAVVESEPARSASDALVVGRYLAVPDAADPRFLLPRNRRAAAGVLRHFRSDGTPVARRRIAVLRAMLRLTAGWPLVRDQITVSTPSAGDETIESHLRDVLGEGLVLGIHLGPPRANRKPILQVLDGEGQPRAFGKLGVNDLTRRLVDAEVVALEALGRWDLPGIRLPELLHAGPWRGGTLLVTTPLPLAEVEPGLDPGLLSRAMRTVARAGGVSQASPLEADWLRTRREQVRTVPEPKVREALHREIERLATDERDWAIGCWHGDWTVWNCAQHGTELMLWDFERFETGVPLGWDALHLELQTQLERRPPRPAVARDLLARAPELLAPFEVAPETATDVAVAYLVELGLRYSADGQRRAGSASARVEEWLLPVLPTA